MRAYERQADGTLAVVDKPDPIAADGEVLIEVLAAGICGTDLKIARGQHRFYPEGVQRIPGHETVGVVRVNNSADHSLAPGTRVAVAPNISCGECRRCRAGLENLCSSYESTGLTFDGGFATLMRLPRQGVQRGNLIPIPESLPATTAALMEPVAAVVRGLRPLNISSDDVVLVCGAGPMGLISLLVAKIYGARTVIVSQTSEHRRRMASAFGADATIDPRAKGLAPTVRELTDGEGADVVVIATPVAEVFPQALEAAAPGGRINFFAGLPSGGGVVPLDANLVHYGELMVTGSTANTNEDCREALALLAAGEHLFAPLVTHIFELEDASAAFAAAAGGEALKVLIRP